MRGRALRLTMLVGVLWGLVTVVAGPAGAKAVDTLTSRDGIAFRSITVDDQTRLERVSHDPQLVATLDEPLTLRLVEPGGQRVVLGSPLPKGADTYHPGGRASTHLVVVDVTTGATRAYDLNRNVEPEAFGVGSPTLFVIDHHPARNPTYYRVASMSLETGQFSKLAGPDKSSLEDMVGTARQQVYASSGRQLYTLYAQPKDADLAASSKVPSESFVHVLDLGGNWAYCVDLPESFGRGSARSAGIALDPSGNTLYVADARARKLAALDTRRLEQNALINNEPPITVVALPRSVTRHSAIALTTTATGVSITAGSAHFTYDPATAAWINS
ncbi:MAG: hypothetical protein WD271_09530 [Acidimicrobiia bacterium]